jgi:integration host factor subunit beta
VGVETEKLNGGHLNKLELIRELQNETDLTKADAQAVVDIFFGDMADALAKGRRVEIRGLCSFYVKKYKSYMGRNPKSGKKVKIKAKKLPFFKCGKELRERVDFLQE